MKEKSPGILQMFDEFNCTDESIAGGRQTNLVVVEVRLRAGSARSCKLAHIKINSVKPRKAPCREPFYPCPGSAAYIKDGHASMNSLEVGH